MLKFLSIAGSNNSRNKDFQFWRQDNHAIEVYSNFVIDQKIEYIHQNPVVEGWVANAEEYLYSSAVDYTGLKGLVQLEIMERSVYEHS